MTTIPLSGLAALSPNTTSAASPASKSLGSQDVFLQLLISQLKNQDPSQPTDGRSSSPNWLSSRPFRRRLREPAIWIRSWRRCRP